MSLVSKRTLTLPPDSTEQLCDVLEKLKQLVGEDQGGGGSDDEEEGGKETHLEFRSLSQRDVKAQRRIFSSFDSSGTGQLAQLETLRMLKAMRLFRTDEEMVQVVKQMDEDGSGTIDQEEYLSWIDEKCTADPSFHENYRRLTAQTKLGFDGTTWRQHANITWMATNCLIILTSLAVLAALIYFKFILVPLTMAYFMTFLLGPIQDMLIQRPLVCCDFVLCDTPGCRPAYDQYASFCCVHKSWEDGIEDGLPYKTPTQRWTEVDEHGKHVLHKEEGQWDSRRLQLKWRPKDEPAQFCYFLPPKSMSDEPSVGGSPAKKACWQLLHVAKVPEALSVLMTLAVAGLLLSFVTFQVANEIMQVLEDPDFRHALKQSAANFNGGLRKEFGVSVKQLEGFAAEIEVVRLNNTGANATASSDDVSMSAGEVSAALSPFVVVINDVVLTLLLCLYMLSTRVPSTEEETYKKYELMSIGEKINHKVKHYVVLKTALSALTGGMVGMILGGCNVRLFVLFALLTFLLNYIPNVGSMVAMLLPIPVIIVDTYPEDAFPGPEWLRKATAILLPALVQGYVGNVLEPAVFGKSLNVTAISVLIALVLWGAIWGLQGAILSVPLLAAMKTMLEEADHPLAKMFLRSIRESAAIDDTVEQENNRKKRIEAMRPKKPLPDLRQPLSSAPPKKRAEVYSNPILSTAEEKD